jgi:hypothetical protein
MSFDTLKKILSGDVANAGTFTVDYLPGRSAGSYRGGRFHEVNSFRTGRLTAESGKIGVSFGASSVTITNLTGQTMPEGSELFVQLDRIGPDDARRSLMFAKPQAMADLQTVIITLGNPVASDADGIVETQNCTLADGLATGINGAFASGGVATLDVARNVVAAWTGTAVLTVSGFDEYDQPMTESSASGTSMAGKKAFKRIASVTTSADITALTVGTGKVLGIPVFIPGAAHIIRSLQDGGIPTAGTALAGDLTKPTATTGDVRGTYAPNANPNGTIAFQLIACVDDVAFKGLPQYSA